VAHTDNCALPRLVWFFKGMIQSKVCRFFHTQGVGAGLTKGEHEFMKRHQCCL
jgi:hypothetical protein